jgi:hypothetical protein
MIVADAMPFEVPACCTFPVTVNGAVGVVVVVVVVGAVAVDGLHPAMAAQSAPRVSTRANCEENISTSYQAERIGVAAL